MATFAYWLDYTKDSDPDGTIEASCEREAAEKAVEDHYDDGYSDRVEVVVRDEDGELFNVVVRIETVTTFSAGRAQPRAR